MKLNKYLSLFAFFSSLVVAHAGDGWMTDFKAALVEAKQQEKPILVDFTGSDWCGWCIRLDKEVFSKAAFLEFANDELILVEIDFPRGKKQSESIKAQNEQLLAKYGVLGFPTILLLDSNGQTIGKTGYRPGGPEAYVEHIKEIVEKGVGR